jgi:hypothetical protein
MPVALKERGLELFLRRLDSRAVFLRRILRWNQTTTESTSLPRKTSTTRDERDAGAFSVPARFWFRRF